MFPWLCFGSGSLMIFGLILIRDAIERDWNFWLVGVGTAMAAFFCQLLLTDIYRRRENDKKPNAPRQKHFRKGPAKKYKF